MILVTLDDVFWKLVGTYRLEDKKILPPYKGGAKRRPQSLHSLKTNTRFKAADRPAAYNSVKNPEGRVRRPLAKERKPVNPPQSFVGLTVKRKKG